LTDAIDLADRAGFGEAGRGAPVAQRAGGHTIHGGHTHELRQTVLALLAGHDLSEHDSPGEATLQVLQGRVRLTAGDDVWDGEAGDYIVIPAQRHALHAVDDSVVMLTVLKTIPSADH
jgi:quercetin dioxygenase-like cupin family protein